MRFIAGDTGSKPASEGPVHLLIVDDDAAVVEMTRLVLRDRMLVGRPVVTHTASSAAEARAFLTADPPPIAVAIIDVVMESQDAGLKLVQWIRGTPSLQEMRIVICTGQPGQASESRVLSDYDINAYWPKTSMTASSMRSQLTGLVRSWIDIAGLAAANSLLEIESQHKEERLASHSEWFETVADALDAGLILIDNDDIQFSNRLGRRLLGLADPPTFTSLPDILANAGPNAAGELDLRTSDGSERFLRYRVRGVSFENRRARLLTIVDQTEQRRAAQQRLVAETKLIEHQHAEQVASLAGGVAHDLNNMMTAILCNAEAVQNGLPPEDQAEAIMDVVGAGQSASALVQQLLAYSGASAVLRREIDVARCGIDAAHLWRAQARRADVSLRILPALKAMRCECDSVLVQQIVGNLVSNAIRHSGPKGSVIIRFVPRQITAADATQWRCAPDFKPGDFAVLSVSDSGSGVPDDLKSRVFEPYFTTSTSGRGLGLAAVHGSVMRLSSALRIGVSTLGGAEFCIAFPLVRPKPMAESMADERLPPGLRGNDSIHPPQPRKRVLVLEDQKIVRRQITRLLRRAGYDPVPCETVEEAVSAAVSPFAAAIIDFMLENDTGDVALRRLRGIQPSLPAILCSGYVDASMDNPLLDDFDAVVPKPFRTSEFLDVLNGLVNQEIHA